MTLSSTPEPVTDGDRPRITTSTFWRWLAVIVAVGLAIRLGHLYLVRDDPLSGDGKGYNLMAAMSLDGRWFVNPLNGTNTAIHPPLWTLLLAGVGKLGFRDLLDQQVFASLLGTATVALVAVVGRRLGGDRVGLIAGAIAAVYPGLWIYERTLLSETLLLFLIAVTLIVVYRFFDRPSIWGVVALGLLCGLLTLTRSEQVLLGPLLIAPLVLGRATFSWARRLGWLVLGGVVMLATIAPWTAYNRDRFANPVLLSNGAGQAAAVANCDQAYYGPLTGSFDNNCVFGANLGPTLDESQKDAAERRIALDYARDHLGRAPVVVVAREARTFGLFSPFRQLDREWEPQGTRAWVYLPGLFMFWGLAIAAVYGAIVLRRRRIPIYPLMAFLVTVVLAVAVAIGETRYRAPFEVPLVLLAAVAIGALLPDPTIDLRDASFDDDQPDTPFVDAPRPWADQPIEM